MIPSRTGCFPKSLSPFASDKCSAFLLIPKLPACWCKNLVELSRLLATREATRRGWGPNNIIWVPNFWNNYARGRPDHRTENYMIPLSNVKKKLFYFCWSLRTTESVVFILRFTVALLRTFCTLYQVQLLPTRRTRKSPTPYPELSPTPAPTLPITMPF